MLFEKIDEIMSGLNNWMIDTFGYATTLRLQDITAYASGMLLGAIIIIFICAKLAEYVIIDHDLTAPAMLRITRKGKKYMIVNPKSPMETIDVVYCLILWKMVGKSDEEISHLLHNRYRLRLLLTSLIILAFIVIFIGICFSLDVLI